MKTDIMSLPNAPHYPTPEKREIAARMFKENHTQEDIAYALGITVETLVKHYEKEVYGEGPYYPRGSDYTENRIVENEMDIEKDHEFGRPEHQPSEELKSAVMLLAAFRIPQYRIANSLGITPYLLRRYYSQELNKAETVIDAHVLKAWFNNITKGKELTVLAYMNSKFFRQDVFVPPPPPATDVQEVTAERVRKIAQQINDEY